ncbi:Putative auto-transporter adhesin, head GIN domain [Flavobacterium omnivorum]|uniref:Putative auto-transporter adhesin, head GIN domain n=1 Tax=Flavobacterium omnivorum TaxID=178355 RepID=A0A1G7XF80_9FLAO|nr:head GIN domain-containing protein [Flavobacterium omnivorum]SDG82918.1 Putative auto-transporter adhesin, head GIN domain [Flavobacterium omnivorum]
MLKVITLITKFIVIALTALLFASCNHSINLNSIEGSGNVTTEKRNVEDDFKSIEVNNGIDVVIVQADKTEIVVEADDNLQKHITTKVKNGTLVISCDKNYFINTGSKKVMVKMPIIDELEATSSATITSKNTLKGENVRLNTSSGASIDLSIESDTITCDASSGSTITINGKALQTKTTASSGSEINADELLANEVTADVSSGASISVHPIVKLVAQASSGGNISYAVQPKSIQKETSSGGSISRL